MKFGIDIDADRYRANGTSKAKRLRTFLALEDEYTVSKVLRGTLGSQGGPPDPGTRPLGRGEAGRRHQDPALRTHQ